MFKLSLLAENIKKYRKQKKLTQSELAEKLYVSAQSISKWECGLSAPDLDNLCKLSVLLNVSVDKLLGTADLHPLTNVMIAIDGCDAKTEFLLFAANGTVLNQIVTEGANPNVCGIKKTCAVLKSGIDALLTMRIDVISIFAGIAGCDSPAHRDAVLRFLRESYPEIIVNCGSDILNVTASATSHPDCIAVMCGTGSVVYASKQETLYRLGGWGYLLGDPGSAYELGKAVLCAAMADAEGFGPKTLLTALVREKFGFDEHLSGCRDAVYQEEKGYVASCADLLFEACKKEDRIALSLLEKNTSELAVLINHASKIQDCGNTVVLSGRLAKWEDPFISSLKRKLDENLTLLIPSFPPIYGACVQCCRLCGIENPEFEQRFRDDYKKFN